MTTQPDLFAAAEEAAREADLPPELVAMLRILENRVGAENAITAGELAQRVGLQGDGTRARMLIKQHFHELPFLLVADGSGYYQPKNLEEVRHYAANLTSRVLETAVRLESFLKHAGRTNYRPYLPAAGNVTRLINHVSSLPR